MKMMRVSKTAAALALCVLLAGLTSSTPVWASRSTQGADYSYVPDNTKPTICDQEADANTAYVKGYSIAGNSFRVEDQDGSSGYCWYQTYPSGVAWHQTMEDINNAPDYEGNISYH